ncbi:arylsulfatase A-like enzyme [Kribbella amoyensis]|uniref:Arylsulfatase A-like enzyme n=1 Tax=Kribbella amoyensis TaxID=996641 RepID=A0A561AZL0_9ACTN|nr:sulfatase-like hydrolase/transferase [Kribbella amoyensis]TWD72012.1 arylsulfatase A-like enzyme [Kribbella amoyensis]
MNINAPNFVVVMTDDQGAWATGAATPELRTPTLDALAAGGLVFENFFCASPVCSPARASVLTGRMPSAHGVHDWLRGDNDGIDTTGISYLQGLTTTPEVLAANGYVCAHSGKWHLGDARSAPPGFSHWFSHRDGGGPYYGAPVIDGGTERSEPGYVTDAISDHAVAMVGELATGDRPFYLQVNYTAPHTPWSSENHPADLLDLYRDCEFPSVPREQRHPWFDHVSAEFDRAQVDPRPALRGYCSALSGVDRGVARVLAALEAAGVRDDTYVIFTSDDGFSCGHHGYWGKGNGTWPLNVWDPSIRVPFVVNRPGHVAPGVVRTPISAVSIHPTLVELADAPLPPDPLAAGTSFAPRILGTEDVPAEPVLVFDEYGGTRMIRTATEKYVWRHDGPEELYDLVADPGELVDLSNDPASADRRAALRGQLADWFAAHAVGEYDGGARPVTGLGQRSPVWTDQADADRYVWTAKRRVETE